MGPVDMVGRQMEFDIAPVMGNSICDAQNLRKLVRDGEGAQIRKGTEGGNGSFYTRTGYHSDNGGLNT